MSTKGIILATFGSIYGEAVEKSVGIMEAKIKKAYPDAVIRRVFLAEALVEKWNEKYEKPVQSLEAVLAEFKNTGVRDVFVLPFALVADQCYQKMRKSIAAFTYNTERNAMRIHVGKPLLVP